MTGTLIRWRELGEFSHSILGYSMVCLVLMGCFFPAPNYLKSWGTKFLWVFE